MDIYFDSEFDAIRAAKGHVQCLISLGMVAAENGEILDSFYSLIRPRHFRRLSWMVKKMTGLSEEAIRQAPSFAEVMNDAEAFIQRHLKQDGKLYSFGPDDRRTIAKHSEYEQRDHSLLFEQAIDLQRHLSSRILWQNQVISPTLSLEDLKNVYGIVGAVEHNAWSDAVDLMRIHEASRHQEYSRECAQVIYERKQARILAGRQRSYENMIRVLHKRYDGYDDTQKQLLFYPDVIVKLSELAEREDALRIQFYPNECLINDLSLNYDQIRAFMKWNMHAEPNVLLTFHYAHECIEVQISLNYRNAIVLADIWNLIP